MRDVATKNSLEQIPLSMLSGGGNNNVGDYFEKETVLSEISLIVVVKEINLLSLLCRKVCSKKFISRT